LQAYQKGFRCIVDNPLHFAASMDNHWPRPSASDLTERTEALKEEFDNRFHGSQQQQQEEQEWEERWQQEMRDEDYRRHRMGGI